jgi:hypothetical protein
VAIIICKKKKVELSVTRPNLCFPKAEAPSAGLATHSGSATRITAEDLQNFVPTSDPDALKNRIRRPRPRLKAADFSAAATLGCAWHRRGRVPVRGGYFR